MSDRFFRPYEDDDAPRRDAGRAVSRREPVLARQTTVPRDPGRQDYGHSDYGQGGQRDYDPQHYDPRAYDPRPHDPREGQAREGRGREGRARDYDPRDYDTRDYGHPDDARQDIGFDRRREDRQGGYPPRDYAPRDYAPRDYAPRDDDPRDNTSRDHAPRDYAPRDYAPRDYAPSEYPGTAWAEPQHDDYGRFDARKLVGQMHDPRLHDPRLHDPRLHDPRLQDPRLHDNRAPQARDDSRHPASGWEARPAAQPMFANTRPSVDPLVRPYPQTAAVQPDRMAQAMQWVGTLCSAAILFGSIYWGYELAVRDVQGIPVVRAAAGPLRIAPEVPGGKITPNQGLAVNAIAASGAAQALPEQVTLAPAPLALAAEDLAPTDLAPDALSAQQPAPVETVALADLPEKLPDDMPISDAAAVEAALNMALTEGEQPPETVTKSTMDAAQPLADEASLQDAALVTAPPTAEIDPAAIPIGTKMVQLGAFDDETAARSNWADLQTRFAELIGTKAMVVQQAKSGGRLFYRLRAHGFADEDETRRFCAALLAENASCIPVAQR